MDSTNQQLGATPNAFNRKATGTNDALGPLETLVVGNHWLGDTGFNLMVVPNPTQDFLVMISPLFETHSFTAVPAPVPNRTPQNGTEQIGAVKYTQTVAENVSKNILHEETGMWLNQTLGTLAKDPTGFGLQMVSGEPASSLVTTNPIMRSGTIPHGNTIHATGVWNTYPFAPPASGNVQPYIATENFQNVGGNLQFLPTYADGSDPTDLQAEYKKQIAASLALIKRTDLTVDDFINPIGLINKTANNIVSITSMAVTTADQKGGVLNIPFEKAFAGPQDFICTFMIETINNSGWNPDLKSAQDETATFFQLQYLQSIPLLFPVGYKGKAVLFPHWNFNTLIAV